MQQSPEDEKPDLLNSEPEPEKRSNLFDEEDEKTEEDAALEKAAEEVEDEYIPTTEPGGVWPLTFFIGATLLYLMLAIGSISEKYVDFGDGNYLYISWRVMLGELLYSDLPSPQPPLLLFLGSILMGLGGGEDIFIRLWQVIQHALTACCVVAIGHRMFAQNLVSYLAGAIYLFLPEGVWWSAGFQSEPLLILLQALNLLLFLTAVREKQAGKALYASALVSVLCCYVNMTALPYVVLQWFFVWLHFRPMIKEYALAFLAPAILMLTFMLWYSNGQYIDHVFFRQVGTYPTESMQGTLSYFISKLVTDGGDILHWEGGWVFASMAGILLFAGDDSTKTFRAKPYIIWWAIFSLGSIIFVTKGGTVEYIFTLGEPAVALFASFFICTFFMATGVPAPFGTGLQPAIQLGKWVLLIFLVVPALVMKPIQLNYYTFTNSPVVFELSHDEMIAIQRLIQSKADEDDEILAPPYFAYHAKRKIVGNMSSLFILLHAYYTEWEQLIEDRDLPFANELPTRSGSIISSPLRPSYEPSAVLQLAALFGREPKLAESYPAIALFLDVRSKILSGDVPIIIANTNHPFFHVPPLDDAIRKGMVRSQNQLSLANREENLIIYESRR
ncbi:MAG: glycosyltransferase family 39 protein [Candidatus Hinthialibacter antarcticus]|nr:glycosyltransferase family 39 protein [Candidatus Hinthialibacter antarcticus]